ncbi:hypothetical protein [Hoylesella nanceiensis]|uniref:hypothetical protein n=1 Tax=Hoylesella nanceiensis TaxID=425941 RepID=UPI0028E5A217|nr:hypothetical protein [Hoylesella nanceiensis]
MKKYLLSCIAFSVLLFTGCADENMPTTSTESTEPGITVSMDLAANLETPNSPEGTRAIGYKGNENADPTKSHGYPIPIGIFNKRSNDATEIADGTEVPVVCIFKSTDKDQPVTKVVTKWTYKKGGNLRLAPTSTFEMEAGTDLTKGTWYVCGILGGEQLPKIREPQVKFNGYSEGHTTISRTGEEVTWGADIPYLFSWRKLEANAAKKSFKADKAVLFKQFGTIVRLRVENNTGFDFQYNGVRIITSNILRGQFDLKVFDKSNHDFIATTLKDTQDSDVARASSESFQKAFQMFKFYQRPLDDAAMTGEIKVFGDFNKDYAQESNTSTKVENTALTYYDHIFLNRAWDKVYNGKKAPSYIYVWMAPQTQAVKTYPNKVEGEKDVTPTIEHVQKTQFFLFAKPLDGATSTRANNEPVPTSINMIPAYGTLKSYLSGANYVANGKVVFEYAPLSYIAKHDNFGTEAEVESTSNQTIPATNRYAFSELSSGAIPTGYKLASHLNWRTIFAQGHGFAGLRKETSGVYDINGTLKYPYSIGYVSYAQMPNASEPVRVFHTYSSGKNLPAAQQGHIAYMIGMAKKPSYITDDLEGNFYQGRTKQPAGQVRSGMDQTGSAAAPWITDNKYQYVMRWEDKDYANKTTGRAVLSQRYLGPRFVLDMDDIAREEFWTLNPKTADEYPAETSRTFPLGGFYAFEKLPISGGYVHAWYLQEASKGVSAQYWTTDPVFNAGRYAQDVRPDNNGIPPYYAVTFRALDNASGMSGFFYYLYKGVPLNQDKDITVPSTTYQKNLIEKAPVRLWRTTPAKD